MQIDDDLQANLTRPADGLVHVRRSTRSIWSASVVVSPETDWNAYNVEARVLDALEIAESNE